MSKKKIIIAWIVPINMVHNVELEILINSHILEVPVFKIIHRVLIKSD